MKDVGNHDLCLSKELLSGSTNIISSEIQPLAREDSKRIINAYCSQFKENILHCLRKDNFPVPVSGNEDDSNIWHVTYMGPLFSRSSAPTRNFGRSLLQHISEPPSPGPAPSLTPFPEPSSAPSSEPSPAPSSEPSPALSPHAPVPHHLPGPLQPFAPTPFFPKLTPSASDISAPPSSVIDKQEESHSNKKTVVLAVVITALVTFIAAALIFLCWRRHRKTGHVRLNDDRPLLSLSMSDYSVGMYHVIIYLYLVIVCCTSLDKVDLSYRSFQFFFWQFNKRGETWVSVI